MAAWEAHYTWSLLSAGSDDKWSWRSTQKGAYPAWSRGHGSKEVTLPLLTHRPSRDWTEKGCSGGGQCSRGDGETRVLSPGGESMVYGRTSQGHSWGLRTTWGDRQEMTAQWRTLHPNTWFKVPEPPTSVRSPKPSASCPPLCLVGAG